MEKQGKRRGPHKRYTEEFRQNVLAYRETHNVKETCAKYDIHPSLISLWKNRGKDNKKVKAGKQKETDEGGATATPLQYQAIVIPEDPPPRAIPQAPKSKVAVLISDDTQSIIDILKGL